MTTNDGEEFLFLNDLVVQATKVNENMNNLKGYIANNHREFYIKENYKLQDLLSIAVFVVWFVVFLCLITNCLLCCNFMASCCSKSDQFNDEMDLRVSNVPDQRSPEREAGESR